MSDESLLKTEQVSPGYDGKTVAEIVHDFAVVRGDLGEQYARDQLVRIIEWRIAQARSDQHEQTIDGVHLAIHMSHLAGWDEGYRACTSDFGESGEDGDVTTPNPYREALQDGLIRGAETTPARRENCNYCGAPYEDCYAMCCHGCSVHPDGAHPIIRGAEVEADERLTARDLIDLGSQFDE